MADDQRPIDASMAAEYASKSHIRLAWLEEIERRASIDDGDRVLYVTLCGRHALDIELLVQAGLLTLLENGAVDPVHSRRVVAYEASAPAATAVKERFPGLDVREMDIHSELRLQNSLNFPDTRTRVNFEASVINLDYDRAPAIEDSQITVVRAIGKVAQLQAARRVDWTLLLTLNATVNWSTEDDAIEREFLAGCLREATDAERWLDGEVESKEAMTVPLAALPIRDRQVVLLLLVGARVAEAVAAQGWRVLVKNAFLYGGDATRAPMVSWIFRLRYDGTAGRSRSRCIAEALRSLTKTAVDLRSLDS